MELPLSLLTVIYTNARINSSEIFNSSMKMIIKILGITLAWLTTPFSWYRSLKKPLRCPEITSRILTTSATELAAKIRRRELTSEEVITTYIARCKEVNPLLNAVVQDCYDTAVEAARKVDQFVKSGTKSETQLATETPLLGIPVTIKESIAVKDMSHAVGRRTRHPLIAQRDAEVVKLVKKAGALPILVSNTPEMCMCWETYNNVTGTTWNPYDTRKTPGGSSGGEAALLGAGASLLSLSSDIGGSARLPALFCGVFGHKPTPGWVSHDGHTPSSDDPNWENMFTIAPMVRYATDLKLLLKTITESEVAQNRLNRKVILSDIKFYYMEDCKSNLSARVDKEMITGMRRFIHHLENVRGIKVQKADIPEMKYAFETAVMMLLRLNGVDTIFKKDSDPHEWNSVLWEVLKYMSCNSSHILTSVFYGVLKKVADKFPDGVFQWIEEKKDEIKRQFQELLGENGVLIFPTFTNAAHYPYEIYPKTCDVTYMTIFNAIGLPVTQCPSGVNSAGLPIGFQVVGNVNCDHLTIAVAEEVERALGGWREPLSSKTVV